MQLPVLRSRTLGRGGRSHYASYPDASYLEERHRYEPFYTRKVHQDTHNWLRSKDRRVALDQVLREAGAPSRFRSALDFGGGAGHMLIDIDAPRKAVFDLSDDEMEPGIARIHSAESVGTDWGLVLSCQVLEHLSEPVFVVEQIKGMLAPGGWFYAEVPDEHWTNPSCSGPVRDAFLGWIARRPLALTAGDVLSTGVRIKLGVLLPWAL